MVSLPSQVSTSTNPGIYIYIYIIELNEIKKEGKSGGNTIPALHPPEEKG